MSRTDFVAGLAALAALTACDPTTVELVGPAGGVYEPGKGCLVAAEGAGCPLPFDDGAFTFESRALTGVSNMTPATLRTLGVSCARSHCGTGALTTRARYTWTGSQEMGGDASRLGSIRFQLPAPTDLLGKRVSVRLAVTQLAPRARAGVDTGVQALIGVLADDGVWHRVTLARLPNEDGGWHTLEAVADATTLAPMRPAGTKSLLVTEIWVQTYLELPITNGDVFEADFYFDDVGWRPR